MYPETDVPPVDPDPSAVERPELLDEKRDRYVEQFGLDPGLAAQVAFGRRFPLFETAVERGVDPTFAASTLESTTTEIRRDGAPVERLTDDHFLAVFDLVEDGTLAKEGVPAVLTTLAEEPSLSAAEAVEAAGLSGVDEEAVRTAVAEVVERNADQVTTEGMGAFSGLMGEAMGELRGKADGEVVSEALREEIQSRM
jgi:glutamyl-tRNA(Gln) amidotransferase subunit E